ncbi:hypothetical protein ACWKT5_24545 [Streptomyces avermitilis]
MIVKTVDAVAVACFRLSLPQLYERELACRQRAVALELVGNFGQGAMRHHLGVGGLSVTVEDDGREVIELRRPVESCPPSALVLGCLPWGFLGRAERLLGRSRLGSTAFRAADLADAGSDEQSEYSDTCTADDDPERDIA